MYVRTRSKLLRSYVIFLKSVYTFYKVKTKISRFKHKVWGHRQILVEKCVFTFSQMKTFNFNK